MDVDYQANINLLKNAQQAGVSKFIYVSVLNGEKLDNLSTKRKIFTIYRHLLSTTRNV